MLSAPPDDSARDHGQARERCPDTRSASTFLLDVQPPELWETRAVTLGPHLEYFGEQPKGTTRSPSPHFIQPMLRHHRGQVAKERSQAQGRDAGADKSGPTPLRPRRSEGPLAIREQIWANMPLSLMQKSSMKESSRASEGCGVALPV